MAYLYRSYGPMYGESGPRISLICVLASFSVVVRLSRVDCGMAVVACDRELFAESSPDITSADDN